ncbi:ImmA/IrrE family metallo-endopeptidase [Streptomyces sp. CA-111067]|uniref:ImmA/IrrE family metallo-endopeptidase n=1 Tax=Streptomyces sp. CA-111067 TaxID=3240046 RepID=UPI003D98DB09
MALRHGFKAEADRLAVAMRKELGVASTAALDPRRLAAHLDIPVSDFSVAIAADPRVEPLLSSERDAISALTVHAGSRREIWVNDSHDEGRQNSSIDHELSHALLLHTPGPALDSLGCRHWNGDIEEEANWLAGFLLIPNDAARAIVRYGMSDEVAVAKYGVSKQMLTWRLNMSGARSLRSRTA